MKKRILIAGVIALVGTLSACKPLTKEESTQYSLMEKNNVIVKEKTPSTGAWLGILPGGGSFYAREPAVGVVDLLLWPASVFWDPVVGFQMSKKVNFDLTIAQLNRNKSKELSELENARDLKKIDDVTYVTRKREIEEKYDYGVK